MNKSFLNSITAAMLPLGLFTPVAPAMGYYSSLKPIIAAPMMVPTSRNGLSGSPSLPTAPVATLSDYDFPPARLLSRATLIPQVAKKSASEMHSELELVAGNIIRELIIIDAAVPDKHLFYQKLKPGVEIREIQSDSNGLDQLTNILSQYQNLDALHLVSHADDGVLYLGNSQVTEQQLTQQVDALSALDNALKDGADVLLYGCNLAKGDAGKSLLQLISSETHTDVAASNNLTGTAQLNGDWELEIQQGNIETRHPFSELALKDFDDILDFTTSYNGNNFCDNNSSSCTTPVTYGDLSLSAESGKVNAFSSNSLYSNDPTTTKSKEVFTFTIGDTNALSSFQLDSISLTTFTGGDACEIVIEGFYAADNSAGSNIFTKTVGNNGAATITNLTGKALNKFTVTICPNAEGASGNHGISGFTLSNHVAASADTAPTASAVSFSGALQAGEQLAGAYTYFDTDSDTQSDTTFQWYASDNASGTNKLAIGGATNQTFTLTATQVGKYISFEVIPVNANASGSAVTSTINETAVIAGNTAPTISGAPASVTVTEDEPSNVNLSAMAFSDANGDDLTVTLTADAGTIAAAGGNTTIDGVTITNSGTATMTLTGTAANINTYLDTVTNIQYTTAANDTTTRNITVKANDGTADSTISNIIVNITNIADITSNSVPADGTFSEGANLDFTVTFDESVTVTGTPRISLDIGGTTKFATYLSGSPGTTLTFRYTVESGLSDANGITVTNTIDLNGGTIIDTDGGGSGADLTNINFASTTGILIDSVAPSFDVTASIGSITATGATLSVDLNEDGTVYYVVVADGADAPTSAQVKAGNNSTGTGAITSGSFTTSTTSGSQAFAGLAGNTPYDIYVAAEDNVTSTNLQATATKVDFTTANTTPTIIGAPTSITVIEDVPSNVDLSAITFSDADDDALTVTLTVGAGTIASADGDDTVGSVTITNSGTATMTLAGTAADINTYLDTVTNIKYTTAANDTDPGNLGIKANDGTIDSPTRNVTINITDIADISSNTVPTDSTFGNGANLDFTVTFDEAVTVTGVPRILITIGGETKYATYFSGDSTTTLTFRYVVEAGLTDADGIAMTSSIDPNGGTIIDTDGDGSGADLTNISFASTTGILIDSVAPSFDATPSISSITATGATLSVDLNEDGTVYYVVVANDADAPTSAQVIAGNDSTGTGAITSGSFTTSTTTGSQDFAGLAGNTPYDIYVVAQDNAMSANVQATATKVDFTTANTTPTIIGAPTSITVIEDVPSNVDLSEITFSDADDDALTVTLTVGAGTIASADGDDTVGSVTIANSGSTAMTLTGTAADINIYLDTASNIKYITAANDTVSGNLTIKANDGTIDSSISNVTINITDIADISSNTVPTYSTFGSGANLDFTVTFDEAVTVTGVPRILITIGGETKYATYFSGDSTTTLTFRYVVEAGLTDADGIAMTSSIDPNGGTIIDTDGDGSGADLTNISFTSTTGVIVDALAPTITNVTIPNSAHKVGDAVTVSIAAGEAGLTLVSGSVNGVGVTSFTDLTGGNYSATYTIFDGGTDVAPASNVAVSFTLTDSSGNTSSAFSTTINQVSDAIYANLPDINLTSSSGTIAEDGGSATLTGTISGSLNNQWPSTITVNLAYTGTATPDTDFSKSDSFIISALSNSGNTTVTGVADTHYDAASAESIIVNIDSLSLGNVGTPNPQTINITDAESAPRVTLTTSNASIAENGGTSSITAALSNPTYADVSVNLTYRGSAATDGSDYATPSSSIIISALGLNNTAATGITAVDDATADGDLSILIEVDSVSGGSATENAVQQQTVTITDNDDLTPPALTGSTPGHNAVNVAISNPVIGLTFDKNVEAGTGNISLIRLSDSSIVQALAVDGSDVTLVNGDIIANFSITLLPQEQYGVRIDNTAVTDMAGNAYAGLVETELSFTTFNTGPVSGDDVATVDEDASVLIDVLANDSDSEGLLQPSSTTVVIAPLNGQTSINTANGVITYTPNTHYNGSDSFTYTVADQSGAVSALASVTIIVNGINDLPTAVNDLVITTEDTDVRFSILDNDSDIDASGNLAVNTIDPASVSIITPPDFGELIVVTSTMVLDDSSLSEGQVIYNPNANFNGSDSFTYTVTDTLSGVSNIATATISVTGTNDTPVAVDDTAQTDEDSAVVIDVLGNDSDIEEGLDSTSIVEVSAPLHGAITINAVTGAITYTPEPNFHGSDSFSYSVMDIDNATSNAATVSLIINSINDAPVAVDNTVVLFEDTTNLINALGNDSDVDTALDSGHMIDPTTVVIVGQPTSGLVSVNSVSGEISYIPAENFNGSDSFTYTVKDSANLVSNIATINLTITPVNDLPLANNDAASLDEDSSVIIDLLSNDQDIDGSLDQSSLKITHNGIACTSSPCQLGFGTVVDNLDGTVTYTPNANYVGGDGFSYSIDDNEAGRSNSASVSISVSNVNDAPVFDSISVTSATEDTLYSYSISASDIDQDGGQISDSLSFSVTGLPDWLNLTDNGNNSASLAGTPLNNDVGEHNIELMVTDSNNVSELQSFTITVTNTNDSPIIADIGDNTAAEDGEFSYTLDSALFSDVDSGDNLTVTVEGLPTWLSFDSDTLTFTGIPSNDDVGDVSLTVSVTDGISDRVSQLFTLTVANQNDAPLAVNDAVSRNNWLAVDINVLANDIDVDGDNLIILAASVGSGSVTWTDTLLTYTPVDGFTGSAVIEYRISDNNGGVDSALVHVDIEVPDNFFPVISVPEDIEVNANALATRVDLGVATAVDRAGIALPVSLVDGTTFFQPGATTAYWQATDSEGLTSIASQLVKVNPLVSLDKDQTALEGYAVTVDIHLNGLAPVYPLSIPYTVSGSAEPGVDHDLLDGEVVIESGTEGSIRFNVLSDGVSDNQETVVIELSELINLGSNSVHTLTISEQNIAPAVELTVSQAESERFSVNLEDGTVVVEALVIHPDSANQYSYQWSNAEQLLIDSDNIDASFSFDPAGLAIGVYHLELLVTDLDEPTFTGFEQVTILLEQSPTILTQNDSDADGIPDNVEGLSDSDSDGIPDYLDAISECNVIPGSLDSSKDFLVEGEPGVCLRLGDLALTGTSGGTLIIDGVTADPDASITGGVFDFIAYELPEAGQTYKIVLPQLQPIPANPIYRKTNSDGLWENFVETSTDQLWSIAGEPGYCPPPGDDGWEQGLVEGYWCVQLTIKDGGDNDADGLANNTIVDPGGVAVAASSNNQPVAKDDVAQTSLNTPLTLDVLANDTDVDGNALVINSANAVFGSVSIVDNQLYYEPTSGFFGVDTIVYGISDGQGGSNSATLIMTVVPNQVPVVVNDIANTVSGKNLIIEVLVNDSDPEGDNIEVVNASAENGLVSINVDNSLSYVSDIGFTGTDTISYSIRDALGAEASGLVTVTVATSMVKLKNSGGGALTWLLLIAFSLFIYRGVTNMLKGIRQ